MLFICLNVILRWLFELYIVFLLVYQVTVSIKMPGEPGLLCFLFYRTMTTIVHFITYLYPRGKEPQNYVSSQFAQANERLGFHKDIKNNFIKTFYILQYFQKINKKIIWSSRSTNWYGSRAFLEPCFRDLRYEHLHLPMETCKIR